MSDINLLKQDPPKVHDNAKQKRFQLFSVVTLCLLGIISLVLYLLIFFSPLQALQEKSGVLQQQLAQNSTTISKILIINDRVKHIGSILDKRLAFDQIIDLIAQQLSENMILTGISIEDKQMTLQISSPSLDEMKAFLDKVTKLSENKKTFSRIILTSLSIDSEEKQYVADIDLTLL